MKAYTKTGDKGATSLYGGQRVPKDSMRVSAYGTLDELNSFVGLARSRAEDPEIDSLLKTIQENLFLVGADVAAPIKTTAKTRRISENDTKELEKITDTYFEKLPELHEFILPGGTPLASILQVCRAVCRRAERELVALSGKEMMNRELIIFTNRLSSFFFVLARYANLKAKKKEEPWRHE